MNTTVFGVCFEPSSAQTYALLSSILPVTTAIIMLYHFATLAIWLSFGFPAPVAIEVKTFLPLRFKEDGTFKISVMSDFHTGEAEDQYWGPSQDRETQKAMSTILDIEYPQLVVLNGDLITGENTFLGNSSYYIDSVVKPLVDRSIPWASTYGNHDSDFNISREALFAREHRWHNSLTGNSVVAPDAGITNYYLPVHSADPVVSTPEVILWFFDSRGGNEFQQKDSKGSGIGIPDCVGQSVADWIGTTSKRLQIEYGTVIPSYAFFHIPLGAMKVYQVQHKVNPAMEPGINDDNPLAPQASDGVSFEEALLEMPGLIATFSGHDHGDDFCTSKLNGGPNATSSGVHLCFGRHTGYGGYGNWMRGSRQLQLNKATLGKETRTWVRLEDGTTSGDVVLNSTYGNDRYPVVEDKRTNLPPA